MDVSVIVPALNEEKYIDACLESVRSQETGFDYEVIVCDGRSDDRTVDIAGEYADRVVTSKVRSVGVQRNRGADESKGKLLLFLDADTTLPPDCLERAVEKFNRKPKVLGFSAGFRFAERDRRMLFAEKVTNSYLEFRDRMGMATLPGFNTFVRRRAFRRLNGFKDVPLEDIDFSFRLRTLGETHYYTDFYVVTSSRRLDRMGVLGALKYYFEMDLVRMNPELNRLLTYTDYVSCRVERQMLQEAFRRVSCQAAPANGLSASMRDYAQNKITYFTETMRKELHEGGDWARSRRSRLMENTRVVSTALSYLESKTIDKGTVDKALEYVEERAGEQFRRIRKLGSGKPA